MKKAFKFFCVFVFLIFSPFVVQAKSNPYPKMEESLFGGEIINCTWYAWQQAKERMGVELPLWYYVETWYSKAEKAGYSVGKEPKVDSLMIWDYGEGFGGHVSYVIGVNGDSVTYIEGGSPMTEDGINQDTMTLGMMKEFLVGFIYLDKAPVKKEETTTAEKETSKKEESKPKEEPKSTNNYLSDLKISSGEIEFNKDTLEYSMEVSNEINEITITAVAEDKKATINGNETYNLQDGENKITISVKAENGDIKNYIININRKEKVEEVNIEEDKITSVEKDKENKKDINKVVIISTIIVFCLILFIGIIILITRIIKNKKNKKIN